ncbi:MAG: DsrE family protein [Acidiferrobacterales bacterium]
MEKYIVRNLNRYAMVIMIVAATTLTACATGKSGATAPQAVAPQAETETIHRVVWHVDYRDPIRLGRMLTSVNNMLVTYEESLSEHDIRIVFLGAGIRFVTSDKLKKTPFAEDRVMKKERTVLTERLQSAMGQGIKLELCKITADAINLDEATVLKGVRFVPSGVVQIVALQRKGFGYLKAD